ncbi:EamA family transporter RarD [Gammaproteobacteria bacterium]|nr:EamA family transporter RarD [Gammaproteobacteria bacterium]
MTDANTDPIDRRALQFTLGSFLLWGTFPFYFASLRDVSPWEILCHRIVWSFLLLVLWFTATGRWRRFAAVLRQPGTLLPVVAASLLISINWLVFIYAISSERVFDASLGYYINPLVNVALAVVLLGERLRRLQWAAIVLAMAAVSWLVWLREGLPWISLVLACSFGLYGLVRKRAPMGPLDGLLAETMVLVPFALVALGWWMLQGQAAFATRGLAFDAWLAFSGVLTMLPLILYNMGVKRLDYSLIGILQFTVPTLQFVDALILGEPLDHSLLLVFALIWIAVLLYIADILRHRRLPKLPPLR